MKHDTTMLHKRFHTISSLAILLVCLFLDMQMEKWKQWRSREKKPKFSLKYGEIFIFDNYTYIFGCSFFNWNPVRFRFRFHIHIIYVFGRERKKNWHHCPRSFLWPFYHFNRIHFFFISLAAHELNVRAQELQKKGKLSKIWAISFHSQGVSVSFFFIFITQNSSSSSWFHVKCTSQCLFDSRLLFSGLVLYVRCVYTLVCVCVIYLVNGNSWHSCVSCPTRTFQHEFTKLMPLENIHFAYTMEKATRTKKTHTLTLLSLPLEIRWNIFFSKIYFSLVTLRKRASKTILHFDSIFLSINCCRMAISSPWSRSELCLSKAIRIFINEFYKLEKKI